MAKAIHTVEYVDSDGDNHFFEFEDVNKAIAITKQLRAKGTSVNTGLYFRRTPVNEKLLLRELP